MYESVSDQKSVVSSDTYIILLPRDFYYVTVEKRIYRGPL